jgi:hypothetical protein
MGGMVRTIGRGDRRGKAENGYFVGHFSNASDQVCRRLRHRLNVADRGNFGRSALRLIAVIGR